MCELEFQTGNFGVGLLGVFGLRAGMWDGLFVRGFLLKLPQQRHDQLRLDPVDWRGQTFSRPIRDQFSRVTFRTETPNRVGKYRSSTVGWSR
jgi:hypothetical protein